MRKPSFFRFFLFFGIVTALAAGLIYLAAGNIDIAYIKQLVEEQVEKESGRALTISDEFELKLYPVPVITIESLSLANVEQGEADHYALLNDLAVYPDIWALLKGDIQISSISAGSAELRLERYADGSNNWSFPTERRYQVPKWKIDSLALKNGSLTFKDALTSQTLDAVIDELQARVKQDGAVAGTASGAFQDLPVKANVQLDSFESLFTKTPTGSLLQGTLAGAPLDMRGSIGHMLSFDDVDVDAAVKGISLEAVKQIFPFELPLDGSVDVAARLKGNLRLLDAEAITAIVETKHGVFEAEGRVIDLLKTAKTELKLETKVSSITSLLTRFNVKTAVDGELAAKGVLNGEDKQFSLKLNQAQLRNEELSAEATGEIKDLNQLQRVSLDISGRAISLSVIDEKMADGLQLFSPVDFSTKLSRDKNVTRLQDIKLEISEGSKAIEVFGELPDIGKSENFSANIKASGDSLGEFSKNIGFDLPSTGKVRIDATLKRKSAKEKLDLNIAVVSDEVSLKLGGDLMPESSSSTLNIDFALDAKNTASIKNMIQTTLPNLNNIKISGSLDSIAAKVSEPSPLYRLNAELIADGVTANYRGVVDKNNASLQGKFGVNTADVKLLEPVISTGEFLKGVVNFQADVSRSSEMLELQKIVLSADRINVTGDLKIKPAANDQQSEIKGNIRLGQLSFRTPESNNTQNKKKTEKKTDAKSAKKARIFSNEKLPVEPLKNKNVQIDLNIDRLLTDVTRFDDARLQISLQDNRLRIPEFAAKVGAQGRIHGQFELDLREQTPGVNLNISTRGIAPESLSWFGNGELIQGGFVSLNTELRGTGDSVAGIMGSLNGYVLTDIEKSKLRQKGLKLVGGDMLTEVIRLVNPFDKKRKDMSIYCGVVGFNVENGKARTSKGIAVKGSDLALFGAGEINLRNEKLEIVIKPKARKGLGLSASSIAKFVRIGGRLSNLKTEADAKGLLSTGASVGAAVASGGISLLVQGVYDRLKASGDICEEAREHFRDEAVAIGNSKKRKLAKENSTRKGQN